MDMVKLLKSLIAAVSDQGKPQSSSVQHTTQNAEPIYRDQPILRTAAQMLRSTPTRIRQMRTLSGRIGSGQRSMESLFYQQGQYMADFTDDYAEYVPCSRTMPMYYNLKDDELRCYFTWRTRYRQGMLPQTETAYLLLYCYEILNQIGIASPEEGYDILERLNADYGKAHPRLRGMLYGWLPDYAAYYQLPYRCSDPGETALITVLRHSSHTAEELLNAFDMFSKYNIKESKLYAAHPAETAEALAAVYRTLLLHYAEHKKSSYSAFLFGEKKRYAHDIFSGAVFYIRNAAPDGAYRLSPQRVYHCYCGSWAVEVFCSNPQSDRIGAMLRTVDAILREQLKFPRKIKYGELPDGDEAVIRQAITGYFAEQARKNAPVITLDSAELDAIRQAAEHTTDMLTLPEDIAEETPPVSAETPQPEQTAAAQTQNETLPDLPVSAPAATLLLCLLTGESYQPLLDAGHMLSVLADEINEGLYDQFGDTVLDTDESGMPMLVEDYIDELKGMFEP